MRRREIGLLLRHQRDYLLDLRFLRQFSSALDSVNIGEDPPFVPM